MSDTLTRAALSAAERDFRSRMAQLVSSHWFLRGTLSERSGKCGKPTCHCAKPNDPGHDPQLRLTRRVSGKTVTEAFPTPAACRKAQQEVSEFHRFQLLSQELIALNEKICALRPAEQARVGWTSQEKNRLLQSMRRRHAK